MRPSAAGHPRSGSFLARNREWRQCRQPGPAGSRPPFVHTMQQGAPGTLAAAGLRYRAGLPALSRRHFLPAPQECRSFRGTRIVHRERSAAHRETAGSVFQPSSFRSTPASLLPVSGSRLPMPGWCPDHKCSIGRDLKRDSPSVGADDPGGAEAGHGFSSFLMFAFLPDEALVCPADRK